MPLTDRDVSCRLDFEFSTQASGGARGICARAIAKREWGAWMRSQTNGSSVAVVAASFTAAGAAPNEGRPQKSQCEWPLAGMPPHARPFAGDPDGTPAEQEAYSLSRRNFLALVLVLMVGTAGLPHILTRYYTVPTVAEARTSVAWTLFFIALLYLFAPALAVMLKHEVLHQLVGTPIAELPGWMKQWMRVDPGLLSIQDINQDGILQLGELKLGGDVVMLMTPELAGLPHVLAAMVAAGGGSLNIA